MYWTEVIELVALVASTVEFIVWKIEFDRDRKEFWARSNQFDKENKIGEYAE